MAPIDLALLGGFRGRLASGRPLSQATKKAQALLAYLALPPGRPHSREKLAALLWGETIDERARDSLRHALGALRKTLGKRTPTVITDGDTVALNAAVVTVDVAAFERCARSRAPAALARAAVLYRGDLLEGLMVDAAPFEEWLRTERERLRDLALDALGRLLVYQSKAARPDRAIQTAGRLLALDPLQEDVHRTLIRLYVRAGRRRPAVEQYERCRALMQRELGAEPEPETQQLYRTLLQERSPAT